VIESSDGAGVAGAWTLWTGWTMWPRGGEGVHLLLDDVGGLADAADEEARFLEHRRADFLVAVDSEHAVRASSMRRSNGISLGSVSGIPRGAEIFSIFPFAKRLSKQCYAPDYIRSSRR